jgi:hypothetical protein
VSLSVLVKSISLPGRKSRQTFGDTMPLRFARKGYITPQSPTETRKPRIAFPHPQRQVLPVRGPKHKGEKFHLPRREILKFWLTPSPNIVASLLSTSPTLCATVVVQTTMKRQKKQTARKGTLFMDVLMAIGQEFPIWTSCSRESYASDAADTTNCYQNRS